LASAVLVATAAIGLVALLVTAASDKRRMAFTLGVAPSGVAAVLPPGAQACQKPVRVSADFTHVNFRVGTYHRIGQTLGVSVRSPSGRANGVLQAGYGDGLAHAVRVGEVDKGVAAVVCVRNRGRHRVAIYGGADAAARRSTATVDKRPVSTDLTLVFERAPRSALAAIPDLFEHASVFHPGWVEPWVFWLLCILVFAGIPVALALGLASAARDDSDASAGQINPR
jgi:hypothetical protein